MHEYRLISQQSGNGAELQGRPTSDIFKVRQDKICTQQTGCFQQKQFP